MKYRKVRVRLTVDRFARINPDCKLRLEAMWQRLQKDRNMGERDDEVVSAGTTHAPGSWNLQDLPTRKQLALFRNLYGTFAIVCNCWDAEGTDAHAGVWFCDEITLGGHLSHFVSATTLQGKTMDEKESDLTAGISSRFAFFNTNFPFQRGSTSTPTDTQTTQVSNGMVEIFGGDATARTQQAWEVSLNPNNWGVIEVRPASLFYISSPG